MIVTITYFIKITKHVIYNVEINQIMDRNHIH